MVTNKFTFLKKKKNHGDRDDFRKKKTKRKYRIGEWVSKVGFLMPYIQLQNYLIRKDDSKNGAN